jgi:hypothetical protein
VVDFVMMDDRPVIIEFNPFVRNLLLVKAMIAILQRVSGLIVRSSTLGPWRLVWRHWSVSVQLARTRQVLHHTTHP